MRALVWVVLVLATLWSGYWVVASRALDRGVEAGLAGLQAQGWQAGATDVVVQGFPNRLDLTVTDIALRDPVSGWGWQAPFVQVFSLSYQPWRLIAAFPQTQTVQTPQQDITVGASKLQASLALTPGPALALNESRLVGSGLSLRSTGGWVVQAQDLRLASRVDRSRANAHQIGAEVTNLSPDPALLAALAAQGSPMPPAIESARLDATLSFSAALDRHAAVLRPEVTGIELDEALLRWGDLVIFADGALGVDANGFAEGRLEIRIEGWQALPPLLAAAGVIEPPFAPTLRAMLDALAQQGADPGALTLPLTFASGRMSLGPLPLGPAPRLHQRQ